MRTDKKNIRVLFVLATENNLHPVFIKLLQFVLICARLKRDKGVVAQFLQILISKRELEFRLRGSCHQHESIDSGTFLKTRLV